MSLRWGILSTALISHDFCTALQTLNPNDHVVTAVAARDLNNAKEFAEKFRIKKYYDSYDQLCADNEVDIVYIGCINSLHKEMSLKAINNGKHVLCEKPMCLNSKEQNEIFEAAKKMNVFFMEALWTRFFPAIDRLKQEINNGSIGQVKVVQANFFAKIKQIDRLNKRELGGGAILDIGIYAIQMACLIFNHEEPLEIKASGHLMASGVDECASITLKYKDHRMAVITISTNCELHCSTTIAGERGVIQIPSFSWCPTELILGNGEKLEFPILDNKNTNFLRSMGLSYEIEAVRQAINQGWKEHPNVTHDHSRLIMKIMDEARKQLGYYLPVDETA